MNYYLLLCGIFPPGSYYNFLSSLFDYWFPYCIHLYTWSIQLVTVAQHMHCFFKTSYSPLFAIILTSSHSFHVCSGISDFVISLRTSAFRSSSSFIFCGLYVWPFFTTVALYGIYAIFGQVLLKASLGKDIFKDSSHSWIEYYLNIKWNTYFLIFSARLLRLGRHIFRYCSVVRTRFLGTDVMLSG